MVSFETCFCFFWCVVFFDCVEKMGGDFGRDSVRGLEKE